MKEPMDLYICQRCEAQYETWNGACPACSGTELLKVAPQTDRMLGRVIANRYRILRRLGQGGMGAVYLAEQVGIGQQVALKFLNNNLSLDPDVARRFLNEAKSYARVAHPNAVTLHDFGQDAEGGLYISMEYVEGDDLKRLLETVGRLTVHEAGDIILQVADVLSYAHARQVIHRDLKPENIMVRQGLRGWHVKVLDFGIARIADGATRLTAQGAVAGTPRYMAPEQAMGQEVDARADIYAVGLVLFELLTGRQAFDGTTVAEIMHKQVNQSLPRLADVLPELQYPAIEAVLQKATAKKRVERYASMEAFATDLNNALPTLTSRPAISGVSPAVKGGAEHKPSTLLYGDGSEDTMVRGAAVDSGRFATGRVAPIPLTQPAPAPAAGADEPTLSERPASAGWNGFEKTAHPGNPHVPPRRSRAGLVAGLAAGAVLVLGGVGVVAIRGSGGETVPVPAETRAPEAAPVAQPAPGNAAVAQAPGSPASDADAARLKLLAAEQAIKIGSLFAAGELDSARRLLEASSSLEALEPQLTKLRTSIEDASARLKRARALQDEGDCDAALPLYRKLKRDYPQLSEAQRGIQWCQERSLPDIAD